MPKNYKKPKNSNPNQNRPKSNKHTSHHPPRGKSVFHKNPPNHHSKKSKTSPAAQKPSQRVKTETPQSPAISAEGTLSPENRIPRRNARDMMPSATSMTP
ncbi:hypothetical protein F4827_004990 [Paraburkholderia bannensis]|uniref:Uncharacterized protein n=1 Tax=Paraburkholderia bannensis TaxID=765414 RepID=A0A7W9U387_9BURK|nr:hypothetical protein [Paraburkholderia sp. WP4_3_2]MBB6105125.1 hypothetical protein [Paraburkholderia bannensis]